MSIDKLLKGLEGENHVKLDNIRKHARKQGTERGYITYAFLTDYLGLTPGDVEGYNKGITALEIIKLEEEAQKKEIETHEKNYQIKQEKEFINQARFYEPKNYSQLINDKIELVKHYLPNQAKQLEGKPELIKGKIFNNLFKQYNNKHYPTNKK